MHLRSIRQGCHPRASGAPLQFEGIRSQRSRKTTRCQRFVHANIPIRKQPENARVIHATHVRDRRDYECRIVPAANISPMTVWPIRNDGPRRETKSLVG